jgi:superfamily I DNA/RNA helicase
LEDAPWTLLKSLTREAEKEKAFLVAQEYARDLQHYAVNLWHKLADLNSVLPITPDIYLKAWALSKPKLEFDTILYDEAQDASGVMMKLINEQDAQKIWVGDRRQQIYAWRGAVNAMDKIETHNNSSLTQSFRFGQPIAELANCVLRKFLDDRDFKVIGSPHVKSVIGVVKNPKAFICRTNRTAIAELMRALAKGKRVHLDVGVYELITDIESAQALKAGRRPRSPALQVFQSWDEVVIYSKTDVGSDLKPLVKMLDSWPAEVLLQALEKTKSVKAEEADLTIATAHRSKGKEYPSVKLGSDFPWPATGEKESKHRFTQEDAYLLYVALTRAMNELDISECRAAQVALERS